MNKPETIAQRDARLQTATLSRKKHAQEIALASSVIGASGAHTDFPPFDEMHDSVLFQGHPGANAERAGNAAEHNVAKSYHEKRALALDPGGMVGTAASNAHARAALLHEQAAKSDDEGDRVQARLATMSATALEYGETGACGA